MFLNLFQKKKNTTTSHVSSNAVDALQTVTSNSSIETYIQELTKQKQAESDLLFHERQTEQRSFDPYSITPSYDEDYVLTPVEQQFLNKIAGQPVENPYVAGYREYEYDLHFPDVMKKLLTYGYLSIASAAQSLDYLTVTELKQILKEYNLPVSGKKSTLISRIQDSIPPDVLSANVGRHKAHYVLTEKGSIISSNVPISITKSPDFEDACLTHIRKGDFCTAYRMIAAREAEKRFPRGINVDWEKESRQGITESKNQFYSRIIADTSGIEKGYRECLILADMLGVSNPTPLIRRLYHCLDKELLAQAQYAQKKSQALLTLDTYREFGTQYYEILTAQDYQTCAHCRKMNGKRFLISEAKIGSNFPPFCKECRCTTVPTDEKP